MWPQKGNKELRAGIKNVAGNKMTDTHMDIMSSKERGAGKVAWGEEMCLVCSQRDLTG